MTPQRAGFSTDFSEFLTLFGRNSDLSRFGQKFHDFSSSRRYHCYKGRYFRSTERDRRTRSSTENRTNRTQEGTDGRENPTKFQSEATESADVASRQAEISVLSVQFSAGGGGIFAAVGQLLSENCSASDDFRRRVARAAM